MTDIERAYLAARTEHQNLVQARQRFVNDAVKEAREKAEAEAANVYSSPIDEAERILNSTRRAFEDEEIREGEANSKFPVGTKVVRWEKLWSHKKYKAKESGVIEVCSRTSSFPENVRYSRPGLGEPFVRLLKSNGEVGKKFATLRRGLWLPEGLQPK